MKIKQIIFEQVLELAFEKFSSNHYALNTFQNGRIPGLLSYFFNVKAVLRKLYNAGYGNYHFVADRGGKHLKCIILFFYVFKLL